MSFFIPQSITRNHFSYFLCCNVSSDLYVIPSIQCCSNPNHLRRLRRRLLSYWIHRNQSTSAYGIPSQKILLLILDAIAKLRKATVSFVMAVCLSVCLSACPSVRPHGTTRPPLDGFSLNLIFEYSSKICRENSSYIKILQ